jgi:hypothetical protein
MKRAEQSLKAQKPAGFEIIMRYYNNNEILFTENLKIPLNNFNRWWKNYSKYGYGIFISNSDLHYRCLQLQEKYY